MFTIEGIAFLIFAWQNSTSKLKSPAHISIDGGNEDVCIGVKSSCLLKIGSPMASRPPTSFIKYSSWEPVKGKPSPYSSLINKQKMNIYTCTMYWEILLIFRWIRLLVISLCVLIFHSWMLLSLKLEQKTMRKWKKKMQRGRKTRALDPRCSLND